MNKHIKLLALASASLSLIQSQVAFAFNNYFTTDDGHTNWQYVANWSSGVLILLLSAAAITLFFSRRQVNISNEALKEINDELEQRVLERTATLDESNRLLKESNALLEGEIAEHRETTKHLHASQTYIASILESMPLMLVGLDSAGVVTQWNKGAEQITGLKAEDALNKVLWEAYPIMPVSKEKVAEATDQKTTLHFRRSQRGQLHFEITIYPLETESDTGVVILIDNVTQQVHSENKLIERDKMSTMGELASTMAHDINAPLLTIIDDLEKAQAHVASRNANWGDADFATLFGLLTKAGDEGQRAAAITSNLLDFAGSHRAELEPMDITQIMDHSLELASEIFSVTQGLKFSDITIVKDYEKDLPQIPCFASELQQVFLSLLRHSCYALSKTNRPEHKPKIIARVLTCYDSLWIKIQHNGVGLNMDEQQVIFEPYFSNEPVNSIEDYDAGKRLSFSYFIMTEHHEGHMAVTSDVNIGTTFHMELQLT